MLKKIDCLLMKVDDIKKSAEFYIKTLGLRQLWADDLQIGLGLGESEVEIVLHSDARIPVKVDVNYLVEDVPRTVDILTNSGYSTLVPPFDIVIGKCAVIGDPFGHTWSLLDFSKGLRTVSR